MTVVALRHARGARVRSTALSRGVGEPSNSNSGRTTMAARPPRRVPPANPVAFPAQRVTAGTDASIKVIDEDSHVLMEGLASSGRLLEAYMSTVGAWLDALPF